MKKWIAILAVAGGLAAVVYTQYPEARRYLKMKRM